MKIYCSFSLVLIDSIIPQFGLNTYYEIEIGNHISLLTIQSRNLHDTYKWGPLVTDIDKRYILEYLNKDEVIDSITDIKNEFLMKFNNIKSSKIYIDK